MRKLHIVFFISIFSFNAFGQTIGIKVSPSVTITERYSHPGFGYSAGIFYDQKIYKRLGISTGTNYTQFRVADIPLVCRFCECIPKADNIFEVVEIPFDVTFRLSANDTSNFQVFLTGGYSFGEIINQQNVIHDCENAPYEEPLILLGLNKSINIGKIGFEIRHSLSRRFSLAFGGQYKYTNIYYSAYGGFNNWNLFVKTGWNIW